MQSFLKHAMLSMRLSSTAFCDDDPQISHQLNGKSRRLTDSEIFAQKFERYKLYEENINGEFKDNYKNTYAYEGPRVRHRETGMEKFQRKFSEEPAVPIGFAATAFVLVWGLQTFRKGGNPQLSQQLMRWRVILQGATICAFGIGAIVTQTDVFSSAMDKIFGKEGEEEVSK